MAQRSFADFLTDAIASEEFLDVFADAKSTRVRHHNDDDDNEDDSKSTDKYPGDRRFKRRLRVDEPQALRHTDGDRMLCLSGDSHAAVAFQCGATVALQELGQLQRVGVVSASGSGCMLAAALASLWRQTTRHVPDEERSRHTRVTRSWSSVTTRDVSTQALGAGTHAEEYETLDSKSNVVLALRGSGLLRRNPLLVQGVCEPLRVYVDTPHEWNMFCQRLRKPLHWFRSWNHEMVPVIYHRLGLSSIRAGLTIEELCLDKAYSNEPVTPIFNFALTSSHTDALVVVSNTAIDKVHDPIDGRIARRHDCSLGLPLAPHDVDLSRLLASIALPGALLSSLDWHECDDLRERCQRRLTLGNASGTDPLALSAAVMWFDQALAVSSGTYAVRPEHKLEPMCRDDECLFVLDAFTHSPTFDQHEASLRRATLHKLQELTTPITNDHVRRARAVNLCVLQCFDQHILAHAVNARNPVLEMELPDLATVDRTHQSSSRDDRATRRAFNTRLALIPEWYACMRPWFETRLSSLSSAAFRALANWGYVLTYMQHATDVQFAMWHRKNKLLYEPTPSDSQEDEHLLTGFGITPAHIVFTPIVDATTAFTSQAQPAAYTGSSTVHQSELDDELP